MNKDKVAVMTDSGCDLPSDAAARHDIRVLPLRVMYPEKDYADGVDIDPLMVYRRFPDEYPSTSTPSLAEVQDMLDQIHRDGYEKVIAVCISSGLSGTFNTIRLAASQQDALEIFVFDTKNISVASGIWAIWAAVKLENGWSFEEVKQGLQNKIYDSKVMFYMDTLQYLKRGGRVGKVTSIVGEALHLKPIISCNEDGIYYTVSLIRGAKQGKKKLLNEMLKFCEGHHVWIIIGHGNASDEAGQMLELVDQKVRSKEILFVKQITATLAINTGPGLVGIAALRDP
ncbi:MAG: DegV family protein [Lachnospiraceae bacterium]|nr:DegV family protein [Lachnospiraceae bacterium]